MKRNKTCFETKTNKENYKQPDVRVIAEISVKCIKTERSGLEINPDKTNAKEYNADVHLYQVIDACFDGSGIIMIKNYE